MNFYLMENLKEVNKYVTELMKFNKINKCHCKQKKGTQK